MLRTIALATLPMLLVLSAGAARATGACTPLTRCLVEGPERIGPGHWLVVTGDITMGTAADVERCFREGIVMRFTGVGDEPRLLRAEGEATKGCQFTWSADSRRITIAGTEFGTPDPVPVVVGWRGDEAARSCGEWLRKWQEAWPGSKRDFDLQLFFKIPASSSTTGPITDRKSRSVYRCLQWVEEKE